MQSRVVVHLRIFFHVQTMFRLSENRLHSGYSEVWCLSLSRQLLMWSVCFRILFASHYSASCSVLHLNLRYDILCLHQRNCINKWIIQMYQQWIKFIWAAAMCTSECIDSATLYLHQDLLVLLASETAWTFYQPLKMGLFPLGWAVYCLWVESCGGAI